MKTLKSVLLSTSLLMTAPFAAANVEQRDLPGVQAQSAEALEAAYKRYQKSTTGNLLRLLKEVAQVELSTLNLNQDSEILPTMIGVRDTLRDLKAKENKLTAETTNLQTQLETATGEKNDLENQLKDAKDALTQREQSNRQAGEHSLAKIRELTDALQKAKELAAAEAYRHAEEIKKRDQVVTDRQNESERSLQEKAAAVNRVGELEGELQKAAEKFNILFCEKGVADDRVKKLQDQLAQLKLDYESNGREVDGEREAMKTQAESVRLSLEASKRELQIALTAANLRVTELEAQLAAKGGEVDNAQLNAANLRVTELEDALAAAIAERDQRIEKTKHMEALEQLRNKLTAEYDASNNRVIQSLQSRLAEAKQEAARELALFDESLEAANKKRTDSEAAADKRELELKNEVERLKGLLRDARTELNGVRESAIANERDLTEAAKTRLAALEADKKLLTNDLVTRERELDAAKAQLAADAEAHARELEEARTELSTQAHYFRVENDMLRNELDASRAAQANNGQATPGVNRPLFDPADYVTYTNVTNIPAGSAADQSSMHSSASNAGAPRVLGEHKGQNIVDAAQLSPFRPDSQDVSPDKTVLTGPFAAVMKAPAVSPDASDHELDNRSPSQAPAWPAPAAATCEDVTATQIATLQAELAKAQEIVDQRTTWKSKNPPKDESILSEQARASWERHKKYLAAEKDVKRLTDALAALQPAQPAGN